jgi:putative transposase
MLKGTAKLAQALVRGPGDVSLHLENPVYGSRRLTVMLHRQGSQVNRKRVVRLLRIMGIEAIYPRGSLSQPGEGHEIFPYLLKGLEISGPN